MLLMIITKFLKLSLGKIFFKGSYRLIGLFIPHWYKMELVAISVACCIIIITIAHSGQTLPTRIVKP